jgi:hypothetical protein
LHKQNGIAKAFGLLVWYRWNAVAMLAPSECLRRFGLSLKPQLTAHRLNENRMNTDVFAFDTIHLFGGFTTHPLARPVARLPLSRLLAGPGLRRRCFAADTPPNAPSGASNCGF